MSGGQKIVTYISNGSSIKTTKKCENWKGVHFLLLPLGVNFINVKHAHFSYKHLFSSYVLTLNKFLYEKFARLTLMKLPLGCLFFSSSSYLYEDEDDR